MKTKLLSLLLLLAAPLFAHGEKGALTGPNKGRVLTELEPHAELFVTAERKLRLTFIDDAGKPVAPVAGAMATAITGERAAPVTLSFAADGDALLSTAALPEGGNLPLVLRVRSGGEAKLVTIRVQLNLAECGECKRAEYACACDHH